MDVPTPKSSAAAIVEHTAPASQTKRRLENLLNSPILLVVLILATLCVAFKWYALQASLRAPDLPGWKWSAHPNTLLIYYPHTDCGCGPGLSYAISQANVRHFDVAVVTDVIGQKRDALAYEVRKSNAYLLPPMSMNTLSQWLHGSNTVMLHIHDGRIVSRASGTIIPKSF